jgi:bifunctional ADP-heptose synthase (sugar kinase/adenylyltransferase)
VRPDIHVKGADRPITQLPEAVVIKKYGGKLLFTPIYKSTTAIIEKIKKTP